MLIDLASSIKLTPAMALQFVIGTKKHVLYGPEVLLTRSATLSVLRGAQHAILAEMTRAVRDEYKEA